MANEIQEAQNGTTDAGDGKSPQQRSLWVSNVDHIIRIKNEDLHYDLGFYIQKVPEYYRQPSNEFMPESWRIGLHNREVLDISGSESLKLLLVAQYKFANDEDGIRKFCEAVVPDPASMLICYGLYNKVPKLTDEEVKEVLAFDALYLVTKVDIAFENKEREVWNTTYTDLTHKELFLPTFHVWNDVANVDICKVENQIPFDLIKRAIKHIKSHHDPLYKEENHLGSVANGGQVKESVKQTQVPAWKEGFVERIKNRVMRESTTAHGSTELAVRNLSNTKIPYLEQWMRQAVEVGISAFVQITDDFYTNANANMKLSQSHHILDAAYKAICGVDGTQRTPNWEQQDYVFVPSATKLKQSGIKIVGVNGPLCTMLYDPKTKQLSLPKMKIYDETVSIIRNIARYEEYLEEEKCMFRDYIFLMVDLVGSAEDFKYLSTKCGVIENECGSKGYEMFDALNQDLTEVPSSKEHNAMKIAINKRCKLRRYRMWSEFRTLFLSRPWLTLSAIAAILVTTATLIQTYAIVLGTNGMKPHFNH